MCVSPPLYPPVVDNTVHHRWQAAVDSAPNKKDEARDTEGETEMSYAEIGCDQFRKELGELVEKFASSRI
jgi:hypothetical protein